MGHPKQLHQACAFFGLSSRYRARSVSAVPPGVVQPALGAALLRAAGRGPACCGFVPQKHIQMVGCKPHTVWQFWTIWTIVESLGSPSMGPIRRKLAKQELTPWYHHFCRVHAQICSWNCQTPCLGTNPHLQWCLIPTPSQDAARYATGEVGRCGKASLCLSLRRRDWAENAFGWVWLGIPQVTVR